MKPAWYMCFSDDDGDCRDRTGGLPTHVPTIFPVEESTGQQLPFIAQLYCSSERLAVPNTLCVQLYQQLDEPVPVAIRVPLDAQLNKSGLGCAHPDIKQLRIDWDMKSDPDEIPDDFELSDAEVQLMESKVGGTPYYTDDELEEGHIYLFQLREEPAGFNFADRRAIVTMDSDGLLHVRLQ